MKRGLAIAVSRGFVAVLAVCVSCTEPPLSDAEVDLALTNARATLVATCAAKSGSSGGLGDVVVTVDVARNGEVRYARAESQALTDASITCVQAALMRLHFRPGGTRGAYTRTLRL